MAVQIKSRESAEIEKLPAAAQPNIVMMNGKEKEIEQIRIDDPNSIERTIKDLRSLSNEERRKSVKWMVAMVVLATTALLSSFLPLIAIAPVSVMLGCIFGSLIGFTFSLVGFGSHDVICVTADQKIEKLIACQKDLQNEEFRSFVRSFGESVSVDHLLKARDLYRYKEILHQEIYILGRSVMI